MDDQPRAAAACTSLALVLAGVSGIGLSMTPAAPSACRSSGQVSNGLEYDISRTGIRIIALQDSSTTIELSILSGFEQFNPSMLQLSASSL